MQNPKLMIKKREQSEISYDESSDKTIVLNYNPQTINLAYDWSAVREFHDWGIPLVIDLSYTRQESNEKKDIFIINWK